MTMTAIKPIRSEADYTASLTRLEALMDADIDTPEGDELAVLATLVERYEDKRFPIEAPSPVGAIRFRMEQLGKSTRDLVPLIGSRARVSEVLSGARPLSIDMIRALNRHWGIPADILIGQGSETPDLPSQELAKPAAALLSSWKILKPKETFEAFLKRAFGGTPAMAMLRKTRTDRTNAKTDLVALQAWCAAAVIRSLGLPVSQPFNKSSFGSEALRSIARLSSLDNGIGLTAEYLSNLGIALVVLPHLPGTHLDGAAMIRRDGTPIIAMTLRRNRVDSFWFTLLHECAHLSCHLSEPDQVIYDDLEISSADDVEQEADAMAQKALIPDELWNTFNSGKSCSVDNVVSLASSANIHPAIVAGRWQMQNKDFRKFSKLLGHGAVKASFPEFPK